MSATPFSHSTNRVPKQSSRWLQVIVLVAGLIFTAWELCWLCGEFIQNFRRNR